MIRGMVIAFGPTAGGERKNGSIDMNMLRKAIGVSAALLAGLLLSGIASAAPVPAGWTCAGSCGTAGADGVVTLPPNGNASYQWISTSGGQDGVGGLPTGLLGSETNGSTLATSIFAANAGTNLDFFFNFVTADGSNTWADYAWAALFNSSGTLESLLFTARTQGSGNIVPGVGMPPVNAVLTPASVTITGGAPIWSALGGSSGSCYAAGCGYTGWVNANYTIATAGNYYLQIGVTNWQDHGWDTGLAMSGVTVDGTPITDVPEPAELGMFGLGLLLIGALAGLRRRVA
ncbi:NF038132 family protein [Rhodanobacter caeni]|uniref:NF038132 family protein n=1 Tax=Rhodanobacter caeni TaxID=657654 RepID=UPI0031DE1912